jgi:hypothetical protein
MPRYRIHRIREAVREQFRWQAHTGGAATAKPKDYEVDDEFESATPYSLWSSLRAEGNPLSPGDVLETLKEDGTPGELQIFKYVGFEPAKWWISESKPELKAKVAGLALSATAAMDSQSG